MDKFKQDLENKLKEIDLEATQSETELTSIEFDKIIFSDPRLNYKHSSDGNRAISNVVMNIRIPEEESIPAELLITERSYDVVNEILTTPPFDIRALNVFMLKLQRAYLAMVGFLINSKDENLLHRCYIYLPSFNVRLKNVVKFNYPKLLEFAFKGKAENRAIKELISCNLDKWNGWEKYVLRQTSHVVRYFEDSIKDFEGAEETNNTINEYMIEHLRKFKWTSSVLEERLKSNSNAEIYTKRIFQIHKSGYNMLDILQNAFKPYLTPHWIEVINYVCDKSPLDATRILARIESVPDEFIVEILERTIHKVSSKNARKVLLALYELHEYKQTDVYLFKAIDKIVQINTELAETIIPDHRWSDGLLSHMLSNHSTLHNGVLNLISKTIKSRLKPLIPKLVPYVLEHIDSEVGAKAWGRLCRADNDLCLAHRDLIPVCCKYKDYFFIRVIIKRLSGDELIEHLPHLIPKCCRCNYKDMSNLLRLISKVGMENLKEFEPVLRERANERMSEPNEYALTFYLTMLDEDKSKHIKKLPGWQEDICEYGEYGLRAAVRAFGSDFLKGMIPIIAQYYDGYDFFRLLEPDDYLLFVPYKNELINYFITGASRGKAEAFDRLWQFISVLAPDREIVDMALQVSTEFFKHFNFMIFIESEHQHEKAFKAIIEQLKTTNVPSKTVGNFIKALLKVIKERKISETEIFDLLVALVKLDFHLPAENLFNTLSHRFNDKYCVIRGMRVLLTVSQYDESSVEPYIEQYTTILTVLSFASDEEVRNMAHKTLQSFDEWKCQTFNETKSKVRIICGDLQRY